MKSLVTAVIAAALFVVAIPAAAAPSPSHLPQTVSSNEAIGTQQVEIGRGHVDLGPRLVDGRWVFLARDDTLSPPVWRHPGDVALRVNDRALLEVPKGPDYAFVPQGRVHVVPQTQDQNVVWVGWSTQDPAVVEKLDRGGWLTLQGVDGPGRLVTFLANGFEKPTQLWDSGAAPGQRFWVNSNTHTHLNWVFERPGQYTVKLAFTGTTKSGEEVNVPGGLTFLVGDATTLTRSSANPSAAPAAPTKAASSSAVWWWTIGAAGTLLAGVLIVRAVGAARSRKEASDVGH